MKLNRSRQGDLRQLILVTMLLMGGSLAAFLVIRFSPSPELLLPVAMGGGLISYGVRGLRRAAAAQQWQRIPAVVLGSDVQETFVGYPEYVPLIRFEYLTPEGPRVSDRLSVAADDFRGDERPARELSASFRPGSRIDAYVDPRDPASAVALNCISPRRRDHYRACIAGGSLVVSLGVFLVMYG